MDTIWKMIEQYRILLHDVYVAPYIFMNFTFIVINLFLARLAILIYYEDQNAIKHKSRISKDKKIYIIGHVLIEAVAGFIVGYCVMILTLANPDNYIINYFLAPALGLIGGWAFDNCVVLKYETSGNSLVTLGSTNSKSSKKEGEKSSGANSTNNINITVNNSNNNDSNTKDTLPITNNIITTTNSSQHDSDNDMLPILSKLVNTKVDRSKLNHIEMNDSDCTDIQTTIIGAINDIKDVQATHTDQIDQTTRILNSIVVSLNDIKTASMNDKRVALKKLIYDCLDQGYATPEQNDKITIYYSSYVSLGGNGEIKMLYEDHYKKLHIHRHQHSETGSVGLTPKNCEYGKFDDEFKQKHEEDPVEN